MLTNSSTLLGQQKAMQMLRETSKLVRTVVTFECTMEIYTDDGCEAVLNRTIDRLPAPLYNEEMTLVPSDSIYGEVNARIIQAVNIERVE
jgi:hypothetical protein